MKQNKIIKSIAIAGAVLLSNGLANAEETVVSTPAVSPALEIYQNGLMATLYSDTKKQGTWASAKPVGVPIGEFVDAKVPVFSFGNLKQDDTAWSLYPGSHIGVLWSGYLNAEESGSYVLMLDYVKEAETSYAANSCIADLKLSNRSVLKNEFKLRRETHRVGDKLEQKSSATTLKLEPGYYPLELWLHCGVSGGDSDYWEYWTTDDPDQATWTLKLKRPSDRIVQSAPAGTLVWK